MKEAKSGFNQVIYDALLSMLEDLEVLPDLILHKEKARQLSDELKAVADILYKE